jgi:hypothetical protein
LEPFTVFSLMLDPNSLANIWTCQSPIVVTSHTV